MIERKTPRGIRARAGGRAAPGSGPGRGLLVVASLSLLIMACTGERPELISADLTSTTVPATIETTTTTEPPPQPADCVTVPGGGPWQVMIEAVPDPLVACGRVAAHQRVEFVNGTPEQITFGLAGTPVMIQPGGTFLTEPVGTVLAGGVTEVIAESHPVSSIWLVEPSESALAGQRMGLSSFGDVRVGMTPADAAAVIGAPLRADDSGAACYVTSIEDDPYSPLFTVRDGAISIIHVFAPEQVTRSEIGIGSAEADINTAYSGQIEAQPSPDGDATKKLLVFVPTDETDKRYRLVFALENGMVTSMYNGLAEYASTPDC